MTQITLFDDMEEFDDLDELPDDELIEDEPDEEEREEEPFYIQCRECGDWVLEEEAEDEVYCRTCFKRLYAINHDERAFQKQLLIHDILDLLRTTRLEAIDAKTPFLRRQCYERFMELVQNVCWKDRKEVDRLYPLDMSY